MQANAGHSVLLTQTLLNGYTNNHAHTYIQKNQELVVTHEQTFSSMQSHVGLFQTMHCFEVER